MNIENFREFCLGLKGVNEKMPFGKDNVDYNRDLLVFSVLDKWFCFVNISVFDFCTIKCEPDVSIDLQEQYAGIKPGYHMNKRHWISVSFNSDLSDEKVKELVKHSYDIVVATLPKKQRDEINQL
jgi:predicted DNA-binding protein (MmcQ/YjbR family)